MTVHGKGPAPRRTDALRHAASVLFLALVVCLVPARLQSEDFRIHLIAPTGASQFAIRYVSDPAHYYILHSTPQLNGQLDSAAVRLGKELTGDDTFLMPLLANGNRFAIVQNIPRDQPLDLDQDGLDDVYELLRPRYLNPLNAADVPLFEVAVLQVADRPTFVQLARETDLPGAQGIRELKFLVAGVDTDYPLLYFMNTANYEFHDQFAISGLGWNISLSQYNAETYFTDVNRKNIAGSIVAYDAYVSPENLQGLYALEFWPADPVKFPFVQTVYELICEKMAFGAGQLTYHPTGETQIELYASEKLRFTLAGIPVITTEALLGNLSYSPLILGEAVGRLLYVDGTQTVSARDIVILQTLPNDLSHVAAILTETPQTPLSHVNLKARQNNTPNAYLRDASTNPRITPYLGQYVRLSLLADDFQITPATAEEVATFLESVRPTESQTPARDLTALAIVPLEEIGSADAPAFGAKAANVAELRTILPEGMVPQGFAIPLSFYEIFMEQNGLYEVIETMLASETFQSDPEQRILELASLRWRIRNQGSLPLWMMNQLTSLQASFPAGTTPRCRSSSNAEDLPTFNGAGLYDSYTHHADEGHLSNSIRQVWASLWTYRAFEERDFYRIDHRQTAMGVLVHPNYANEQANGVGVTRNIYDPNWNGFYINVQVGEDLVTNPLPNSAPDELLISNIGEQGSYETQYLRHSSYLPTGMTVLSDSQIQELVEAMDILHAHFRDEVYGATQNPDFGMEIEFKITAEGNLNIKQARPWVQ